MSFLDDIKKLPSQKALRKVETKVQFIDGSFVTERKSADGSFVTSNVESEKGHGFVVDLKPDIQIGRVLPGLLLGSQDVAQDELLLKQNNITHILNCSGVKLSLNKDLKIRVKTLNILDLPETKIDIYYDECFEFIDESLKSGCVLVHCNAGVSRSATIIIAYIMNRLKLSYEEAFNKTKEARPSICPNAGFIEQLKQYEVFNSKT